ncbi:hypothetical protein ACGFZQ_25215 [Streptomyces sp. NPDC048254]|uniref:hypothetical protein n=1 Tax=Streptomyces sp. NPDC048254 TaxID=3365525 RepID=UPI00371776D6
MGASGSGGKQVWVAIILVAAAVAGAVAGGVFWVAQGGHPSGDRVVGAAYAGGAAFLGVATLGIAIGSFLSG